MSLLGPSARPFYYKYTYYYRGFDVFFHRTLSLFKI